MKKYYMQCFLLLLGCLLSVSFSYAQICDPTMELFPANVQVNTGATSKVSNNNFQVALTIGNTFIGSTKNPNSQTGSLGMELGFWTFMLKEPNTPVVYASDGDFPDRIEIRWDALNDPIGPPINGVKLYRDNQFLGSFPSTQNAFLDFNVLPGRSYRYDVITSNRFGESYKGSDVGFVNPNGIITGSVQTRSFIPVPGVEVVISPTISYSVNFNGVDNKIALTDSAINNMSSGTIEFWVNPQKLTQSTLFSKRRVIPDSSHPTNLYSVISIGTYADANGNPVDGVPGRIYFHSKNGVQAAWSKRTLPTNTWTHVAITFDGTKAQFYIDGLFDNEMPGDYSIPDDHYYRDPRPVRTFAGAWEGVGNYYQGYMDEVRFWKRIRTKTEIYENKDRTVDAGSTDLSLYWKFDEGQGTRAYDLSGNTNHGLFCSPLTFSNSVKAPVYTSALTNAQGNYIVKGVNYANGTTFSVTPRKLSIIGRSLDFDGIDDEVQIPYIVGDTALNTGSIEAWVNAKSFASSEPILALHNSGATSTGVLSIENGQFRFIAKNGVIATDATPLDTSVWYHVAVVYNKTGVTFYVNGELSSTVNGDFSIDTGKAGTTTTIGTFGGSHFFGKLDEIRVWKSERTQQEIQANMNAPFASQQAGMQAYWKLNEGGGDAISDETDNLYVGNILHADSTIWSEKIPMNETFNHIFQPQTRDVTLAPSSTVIDRIDYTDISLIPIAGFVKYINSSCFAESVQVYVDGAPASPPIYTAKDGKFIAEFEPGTNHTLSFGKGTHTFAPSFYDVRNVSQPVVIKFPILDTQTHDLDGYVVGGLCHASIGASDVTLVSVNGCYEQTITSDVFGRFKFAGVPPIRYNVFVHHPDPTITFDGQQVDLVNKNDSAHFVYRSPLRTAMLDLPQNDCNINVLDKGARKVVKYKVFEEYTDGSTTYECLIPNGIIVVTDNIGNILRTDTLIIADGYVRDTIKGGTPNILGGGLHPYQKQLQIVAVDDKGRQASNETWIYVLGQKPRGTTFATRTPEMPFWILHDPPGDGSYSYVSTDHSMSTAISFSMQNNSSNGVYAAIHLGPDVETSFGIGAETEVDVDVTADFTATSSVSISQSSATEQTWTFSSSEMFKTSEGEGVIGDGADVYVGGAMNMLYGITDVLYLDSATCTPYLKPDLLLIPDNFATTFIYSESQILTSVIPNLYTIGDTASAKRWLDIVAKNNANKAAATFIRNISFDAGVSYENTETTERTSTSTIETGVVISDDIAIDLGLTVNGVGETFGFNVTTEVTTGASSSNSASNTQTFGYVLADNDANDFFSVNIKKDPAYGTPVFQTVSGTSSCPHEPNTLAREGADIQISPVTQINVPPDQDAAFTLLLGNNSPTNEIRDYLVLIDFTHNPNGAYLAINGADLGGGIPVSLPPGVQVPVTLTVTRGPNEYNYDDLRVFLVSACELATSAAGTPVAPEFNDTISFSVHFEVPCSEVAMNSPTNNWLVTSTDPDSVSVTLSGYDKDNPDFKDIRFQYRILPGVLSERSPLNPDGSLKIDPALTIPRGISKQESERIIQEAGSKVQREILDNPWINAYIFQSTDFPEGQNYMSFLWKVTPDIVADGQYEVRAISTCYSQQINGSSVIARGRIDRQPPQLLGSTEPVDGVLGPDDQIIAHFTETIDCGALHPQLNVHLVNSRTGLEVDKNITCNGNTVVITPNVANRFIENQVLRLSFTDDGSAPAYGVRDIYGNRITRSLDYEFYVNRNSMRWNDPTFQTIANQGEALTFTRRFINEGTFAQSFTLNGIPSWLNVSPVNAIIPAGFSQDVTFTISPQLSGGFYKDTVFASTANGDEDLILDFRLLCQAPNYTPAISGFQYDMSILATLSIDSTISEDIYDKVGVFVGNEQRGTANVTYDPATGKYLVFLTIYSNVSAGEPLAFKVWDASSCRELGVIREEYAFKADTVIGRPDHPATLTATSQVLQQIVLPQGWSWFSLNLLPDNTGLNSVLDHVALYNGDIIKSQNSFSQAVPGFGWAGTLAGFNNRSMYQSKMTNKDTIVYAGYPVKNPDTISVARGWNWIAYQPQTGMTPNVALASMNPLNGDLIKSQFAFSIYLAPQGWVGSLSFMSPQLGYKLKSGAATQLIYPPSNTSILDKQSAPVEKALPKIAGWDFDPFEYQYSMALIGTIDGAEALSDSDVVGAFVNGECRGIVQPIKIEALHTTLAFLLVFSNTTEGEEVTLRYFNTKRQMEYEINQQLTFASDGVEGTVSSPLAWTITPFGETGNGLMPKEFALHQNYPNPFNPSTMIHYELPLESEVEIIVYNLLGQKVRTLVSEVQPAGYKSVLWNGMDDENRPVTSGMYVYRMQAGTYTDTKKLVLLK